MTKREQNINIVKLILAPIVYFVLSQGISMVYSIFCGIKIGLESGGVLDYDTMYNQLMDMVMDKAMLLTLIGAVIAIPVMFFIFYDRKEEKCENKISYLFVALLGIGGCVTLNVLVSLSGLPLISKTYQELSKVIYTGNFWFELVTAGIIVPIAEELIFRGIVFKRLRAITSITLSIIISSVLFGIMHGNIVQFVYATLLGAVMCFVYIRCKNILAPIILHISANTFSVLLSDCKPVAELMENVFISLGVILICIILAIVSPIALCRLTKEEKPVDDIPMDENVDEIPQSEEAQQ